MIAEQIKALADEGLSAEEIGEQLALHPDAVRYHLASTGTEDFSDDDAREFADVIKEIAHNGESESNRLAAAIYGHKVKRGLLAPKDQLPQTNVLQINALIAQSFADVQRFVSKGNGRGDPETHQIAENSGQTECPQKLPAIEVPEPRAPNPKIEDSIAAAAEQLRHFVQRTRGDSAELSKPAASVAGDRPGVETARLAGGRVVKIRRVSKSV